jgi:hypothetical protein
MRNKVGLIAAGVVLVAACGGLRANNAHQALVAVFFIPPGGCTYAGRQEFAAAAIGIALGRLSTTGRDCGIL